MRGNGAVSITWMAILAEKAYSSKPFKEEGNRGKIRAIGYFISGPATSSQHTNNGTPATDDSRTRVSTF